MSALPLGLLFDPDAASLYEHFARNGQRDGIPVAPLNTSQRDRLRRDIRNIDAIERKKGLCSEYGSTHRDQAWAESHFELVAWLRWYMADRNRQSCVATRALMVFLLWEGGALEIDYRAHTLTDFGERTLDDMLEQGDGDDVVRALARLVRTHGSDASVARLTQYGWDRP
jgi:hypothetical protein